MTAHAIESHVHVVSHQRFVQLKTEFARRSGRTVASVIRTEQTDDLVDAGAPTDL
ncbi:hypothetical protein MN032_04510 [Agromyces atrinae]|uniref:hypothetical protein n=1 Tax=Agromyces atrinae TaxID=592376 RepID=UPI001F59E308|nr:hypothetical protein [Agromyces atrinae]MCI2956945.1 hypothetical protein [Agromyces atrinae]